MTSGRTDRDDLNITWSFYLGLFQRKHRHFECRIKQGAADFSNVNLSLCCIECHIMRTYGIVEIEFQSLFTTQKIETNHQLHDQTSFTLGNDKIGN